MVSKTVWDGMEWNGVGWGRVGAVKNLCLGHPWSSYDASRLPHNGPCNISRPERQ